MDPTGRIRDERVEGQPNRSDEFARPPDARERQITMFNRKAIVVLASIAGMTVMVVSFAFNAPGRSAASGFADAVSAEQLGSDAERRNYLASPPDTGSMGARIGSVSGSPADADSLSTDLLFDVAGGGYNLGTPAYDPYVGSGYASYGWAPDPEPVLPEEPSARELAFERAMRCGIRSCPSEERAAATEPATFPAELAGLPMIHGEYTPSAPMVTAEGTSVLPGGRHEKFLRSVATEERNPYVEARVQRPASPYQIMAGTLIPVTLVTAINSDLPGDVVAQVTRNVYDTQQRHLLIPAGSRMLGRVDNEVGLGQARVNIAWHRLILPNNNSLSLPGFGGVDGQGAAGIRDRVNNNYTRTYVNALLLSAITAGAQLSQPQSANVYAAPSAGQIAAGALGQRMSEVSSEVIRGNMQVGPTLEVRPGFQFSIYVSQDLILPPYDHYGNG